jgi:hypothetical protein
MIHALLKVSVNLMSPRTLVATNFGAMRKANIIAKMVQPLSAQMALNIGI